jgi:hypothetical protein
MNTTAMVGRIEETSPKTKARLVGGLAPSSVPLVP